MLYYVINHIKFSSVKLWNEMNRIILSFHAEMV